MSDKASTQRPIGSIASLYHVSLQPQDILFNIDTHVSKLADHPSVSALVRAGVCGEAENRMPNATISLASLQPWVDTCRAWVRSYVQESHEPLKRALLCDLQRRASFSS